MLLAVRSSLAARKGGRPLAGETARQAAASKQSPTSTSTRVSLAIHRAATLPPRRPPLCCGLNLYRLLLYDIPRIFLRVPAARWPPQRCLDCIAVIGRSATRSQIFCCLLHQGSAPLRAHSPGSSRAHALYFFPAKYEQQSAIDCDTPWQGPRPVFAAVILRLNSQGAHPPLSKRPGYVRSRDERRNWTTTRYVYLCDGLAAFASTSDPFPYLPSLSRPCPQHSQAAEHSASAPCLRWIPLPPTANLPRTKIYPPKNPPPKAKPQGLRLRLSPLPVCPFSHPRHLLISSAKPRRDSTLSITTLRAVRPAPSPSNFVPFNGSWTSYRLIADFVLHSSLALTP